MVGPQEADETANTVFEILSHQRRRYALECLREYENPLPLADLADEVAVREYDASLPEISAETVKRVYLSLYHTHVPKLAAAEYVRYSQDRDTVTLRVHSEQAEHLRAQLESSRPVTN
ncbi:hypothetical protein Htur_1101 [Haloterrigena turkmenica DSM 5511]|uniref:DUF7344 domain-containing protein n=1 Tax=Haloterrigena turkmenica (strain ATCC 51198 / DSM 5511 / JCM 9101 / NCIMB 13204 / VKM B-1734 / 4k) TaxID=543526 RepID=D2RZ69_HALTV|nr:hypothetical protein [Haloterrigena turkmenica]ADB59993.1 hypothetical protein Htur_1101 [Haloterrigena turkmenica DSM 5511]